MNEYLECAFQELIENEVVFHYTNLSAFTSIINSGELRFTRVDFLNDQKEFQHFSDVMEETISNMYQASEDDYHKLLIDSIIRPLYKEVRSSFINKTFNLSFSKNGNSIPMWNYYADSTGISIGIKRDKIFRLMSAKYSNYAFRQHSILYDDKIKYEIVENYIDKWLKYANEPNNEVESISEYIRNDFIELSFVGDRFKHSDFKYEDEIKFLFHVYGEETDIYSLVEYNVTRADIKPYVSINFGKENWNDIIECIIISPLNKSDNIEKGVLEYLKSCGINLDKDKIWKSKCPIRTI